MKSLKEIDSVGWIFYIVVGAIMVPLGIYASWQLTLDDTNLLIRVGFGAFIALIAAGVVSWGVNEVLFRLARRRYSEKKKAEKKKAKAKKGKKKKGKK